MQKNTSFIDMLNSIPLQKQTFPQVQLVKIQDSALTPISSIENKQSLINKLPHFQSEQLFSIPKLTHSAQISRPSLARMKIKSVNTDYNSSASKTQKKQLQVKNQFQPLNSDNVAASGLGMATASPIRTQNKGNSHNHSLPLTAASKQSQSSRNDELFFQIKLKLVSFITKFNIDSNYLANIRQQSVESILQLVFKRFKQYTKQHEISIKNSNQAIKHKQIQALNLKSKISILEQQICQENNKWSRAKQKMKEQCLQSQKNLEGALIEIEQLQQNAYMMENIIKQQNQYIKQIQSLKQNKQQSQLVIESLQTQLAVSKIKFNSLQQQYNQAIKQQGQLYQQIERLNYQIGCIMDQNKQYKNQVNQLKQKNQKIMVELQQNQQKLIAYYQKYQQQSACAKQLSEKVMKFQELIKKLSLQKEQICGLVERVLLEKQELIKLNDFYRKQAEQWKKQYNSKQSDVIKLNKTLSEVVNSYKTRQLQKKTSKSENQIPIQNGDLKIVVKSEKQIRGISQQQQIRIKKIEEGNQQKIKKIIEQWRSQMQKTVQYYERCISDIEKQKEQNIKAERNKQQ